PLSVRSTPFGLARREPLRRPPSRESGVPRLRVDGNDVHGAPGSSSPAIVRAQPAHFRQRRSAIRRTLLTAVYTAYRRNRACCGSSYHCPRSTHPAYVNPPAHALLQYARQDPGPAAAIAVPQEPPHSETSTSKE